MGTIVCATALPLSAQAPPPAPASAASSPIEQTVRPFVEKTCVKCHKAALTMGNSNLEQLVSFPDSIVRQRPAWESVVEALRTGRMPPQGEPRPAEADLAAVLAAVTSELERTEEAARPPEPPPAPATPDWVTYNYDPERTG